MVAGYRDDTHHANNEFAFAPLIPNGSLDTTFNGDGKLTISFCEGGVEEGFGMVRQASDSKYVLAGSIECGIGGKDFALVRVLP